MAGRALGRLALDDRPTGGNGGVLTGSVVDHLASQASLTYDDQHALLFAVNTGSNTLFVFSVNRILSGRLATDRHDQGQQQFN